jgi:hypothetical protein
MDEQETNPIDLEERLYRSRPVPSAAFRGALRRQLIADAPPGRPALARRLVAAYAASGFALLLIAAVGVAGAGPLAA